MQSGTFRVPDYFCGYIKSDGYLPKAAPKTLRALLKVHWNRAEGAFELRPVGIHPEDVQWAKQYWYRRPLFELKVSSAKDARGFYAGPRTGMVCESLEYLDPAQVKLFLGDMWAQLDGFRLASYACGLLTSRDPLTR